MRQLTEQEDDDIAEKWTGSPRYAANFFVLLNRGLIWVLFLFLTVWNGKTDICCSSNGVGEELQQNTLIQKYFFPDANRVVV